MSTEWNARVTPDRVRERAAMRWTPAGECRVSTYSTGSHGYAQIGWAESGRTYMVLAHRAAWEYVNGPVPVGMTLDHTCKTRRCVNPHHMRVLTNYENARRTSGRDWPLGQCVNGHPQSETMRIPSGKRVCRLCRKEWRRRYEERKKSASLLAA